MSWSNLLSYLKARAARAAAPDYRAVRCPYSPPHYGGFSQDCFLWDLYHEPTSYLSDPVLYTAESKTFLDSHASLMFVEMGASRVRPFGAPSLDETVRYFYRHNIISCQSNGDGNYRLTFVYPTSRGSAAHEFAEWSKKDTTSRVSLLIQSGGSLDTKSIPISPPIIDDLDLNYGTGFKKIHDQMLAKLNTRKASLFLFHGVPGTGKSTYLKHLTGLIDREWIFVPVALSASLASPDFMSLLLTKREAIIILEDAEKAVQARGTGGDDSAVATLLNLADGILGSLLNITIIVTYNADRQFIDEALTRKGRLSFEYDFGPLGVEDSKRLAAHLGKTIDISKPMTLANIYGANDETGHETPKRRAMGFHTLLPVHENAAAVGEN